MAKSTRFQPEWREDVPGKRSYRSVLKYDPTKFKHPSAAWYEMFKHEFAMTDADFRERQPGGDAEVVLDRPCGLSEGQVRAFADIVGRENISAEAYDRVKFGHGKSVDENLALRRGAVGAVPDLVVHPRDKTEVASIVALCNTERIPIVTYGGGSGVVLGNSAANGGIALVLRTHLNKLLSVSEANQTATVQPGMLGPDYEAALNDAQSRFGTIRGYTCGHFPQSFELATVGGWIAAAGSGQASTYYGDACNLLVGAEWVTPAGTIRTLDIPGTATGPRVNDFLKGSEGAYGILVEATMKVFRHLPENRQRFAVMYPSWDAAVEASREIVQGEFGLPAVYRISDPEETEIGLKLKGFDQPLFDRLLRSRGLVAGSRCLCIGTAEGEIGYARHVKKTALAIARKHGATSLTGFATKQWEHGRYSDVHMRDDLLDYGIVIDTLETGVTWENLRQVYEGARAFVKQRPRTLCMTHCSHFYGQGTNLYFIFILRPESEDEFVRFRAGVVDKIVECGGSISHHHGVGRLFSPWMEKHLGREQLDALRALKRHFDPNSIMNPGGTLALDAESRAVETLGVKS